MNGTAAADRAMAGVGAAAAFVGAGADDETADAVGTADEVGTTDVAGVSSFHDITVLLFGSDIVIN
jgi:hypothetical protein